MKLLVALCILAPGLPAFGEEIADTYKTLMEEGYSIGAVDFRAGEMIALLSRGEHSYLCTLELVREDNVYSSGPWNDYRECKRISGGPDFRYNTETGELEPAQ